MSCSNTSSKLDFIQYYHTLSAYSSVTVVNRAQPWYQQKPIVAIVTNKSIVFFFVFIHITLDEICIKRPSYKLVLMLSNPDNKQL